MWETARGRDKELCVNTTGDFDGDLVLLTDNNILVNKAENLPALVCAQNKAQAVIPTEDDFIKSNIASFGNEIGTITNRVTSMYALRAVYPKESDEYKILSYRIQCGQLLQQDCIDKAKGIVSKPMPKSWYNRHDSDKDMVHLVADKKPYFMKYIYPDLSKKYKAYIDNTNKMAMSRFGLSIDELQQLDLDGEELVFLSKYSRYMPVNTSDCIMNKICRRFEEEFDRYFSRHKSEFSFDYKLLKSDAEYTPRQYAAIKQLYDRYNQRLVDYSIVSGGDDLESMAMMNRRFQMDCAEACPDRDALCNIILDICYSKSSTKRFAWSMCATDIIHNLLRRNDYIISFPTLDDNGIIKYGGNRFKVEEKRIEVVV